MADKKTRVVFDDLTGGRNGYDPPWAIANNECIDAVNVDWYQSPFAHKRGGYALVNQAFSAGGPFTGAILTLIRYVPGVEDTAAELWAFDSAGVVGRMAAGTTFSAPTLKDAYTGNAFDIEDATINGKLALAYKSAVARMHGWDGSTVRRFGLAATVAPTAADGVVAGAYPATLRYYRERSTRQVGGVTVGRSEPSASVAFTPNGAFTTAVVTQAAVINEGETHWEVEASIDNITFYRIATVVIGTTTYADSALVATYNTNPLSASTGFYTLQKPYKYIVADQNRLLGFGSHTPTDKQSRIEFSAVIGSSDIGDEERVDTTTNYYLDLDEADSGAAMGLAGPIDGSFFAFKFKQFWRLTPTGNTSAPFRADAISKTIGTISQRSVRIGEDEDGNPCLYWMSHRGPYRFGRKGFQYIGRNIEDLVLGPNAVIIPSGGSGGLAAFTLYYQAKRQIWMWFLATDAILGLTRLLVQYDIARHAWSRYVTADVGLSGLFGTSVVMFSATLGATMSIDLKPYISAGPAGVSTISKLDTGNNDNGTSIKSYVITKAFPPGGDGYFGEVGDAVLVAAATTGATITATVTRDFGIESSTGTASLAPSGSETYITKRLEGSALSGDLAFVQYQVGDAAVTTAAWNLGKLIIPCASRGPISQ